MAALQKQHASHRIRLLLHPLVVLYLIASRVPVSRGSYSYQNYNKNQQQNYKSSYNQNYFQNSESSSYKSSNSNFYNGARDFTVCEDSVVRVTDLYAVCDSPYTFYYGNGANRNSPVCNYGDKLSMEVRFEVADDIQDSDNIYVTMAVYDDQGNMLISVDPVYLCDDLVGYECINQGYYGFIYRLRLPYPNYNNDNNNAQSYSSSSSSSSSSSNGRTFLPYVLMAFSTKADSGYNLGALNIQCEKWDPNAPAYVSWSQSKVKRSPIEAFTLNYGILVFSCIVLALVSAFVWHQATMNPEMTADDFEVTRRATICLMD